MSVTCPFCNSVLPSPAVAVRMTCPRCGEAVGTSATTERATCAGSPVDPAAENRPRSAWLFLVPVGFVMVAVLGAWAVSANWDRSPFDTRTSPDNPAVVKPTELPGLGYLPESTEVVLAFQLPAVMEKVGADDRDKPATALARLGLPRQAIDMFETASGVGLANVDHLVVGVGFAKGSFPPQVVVVVHTRQPYDMARLVRDTKARTLKKDGRTLHAVKSSPMPELYWWGPNDRVLVAALFARDFENVPQQPVAGTGLLRPDVADLIRHRITEDAPAWFVASSDRWAEYLKPYTFRWGDRLGSVNVIPWTPLEGRDDLVEPAGRLRSFSLSIPQAADSPVDMQIELRSADGGDTLRTIMADRFRGEQIDVSGDGELCRLQTSFEPVRVGGLLGRLIGPAK